MKLKTKQALTGLLLCVPIVAGIVFLYLLPFGMALWRSFHQGMSDTFVGLENYIALFGNSAFQLAAKNTLLFWGIAFPMNLAVGLLLALLCERVAASTAKSILFFPAMLPAACVVAVMRTLLAVLPSGDGGYAGGAGVALMLLIYLWKSVGYTVIILATALHTIPKEIVESAHRSHATPGSGASDATIPSAAQSGSA